MRKQMDIPGRMMLNTPLPFDYALHRPNGTPTRLFLLLHGHGETGRKIFDKLSPVLPKDAAILAPNGPFPISEWIGTNWKTRQVRYTFCWHYYEPATDAYYISPETALSHLEMGVAKLGLADLPKTVIGFSQGGYLAHYVAKRLSRVEHVVAIGCEFLPEDVGGEVSFRIDGIYGEKDHILDPAKATETHQRLLERAPGGELFAVPGLGHELDDRVAARVGQLVTPG
jgi:predicted esterase